MLLRAAVEILLSFYVDVDVLAILRQNKTKEWGELVSGYKGLVSKN
jgi:predicted CDP-diglyceride synthetase/phosphatidate cytidylyltransferase